MQIKNILRYKMLINWSYIIGYLLVTPFICIFLYTYRHLWWLMITMFGLILAGVLTDYFLFHHVSDRIKELTHVNKELMELKKKHKRINFHSTVRVLSRIFYSFVPSIRIKSTLCFNCICCFV